MLPIARECARQMRTERAIHRCDTVILKSDNFLAASDRLHHQARHHGREVIAGTAQRNQTGRTIKLQAGAGKQNIMQIIMR